MIIYVHERCVSAARGGAPASPETRDAAAAPICVTDSQRPPPSTSLRPPRVRSPAPPPRLLQTFDKKKALDKISCPTALDMGTVLAAAQVGRGPGRLLQARLHPLSRLLPGYEEQSFCCALHTFSGGYWPHSLAVLPWPNRASC